MASLVTLTTDFTERDPFVASTKGVLCARCPGVQIVNLTHDIPRQSIREGALFVAGAFPYFPKGAIHLVAVASGATPVAVSLNGQVVVGPDNGILTLLAERYPVEEVRAITNPDFNLSEPGQIYYARDMFAPAAAHLASGGSTADLGEEIEGISLMDLPRPESDDKSAVSGRIIHVNRFGSLVTNIHRSLFEGRRVTNVVVGDFSVGPLSESYASVAKGSPLALFGSADYLEIAYNGDRADKRLDMGVGIIVNVAMKSAYLKE